MLSGMLWISEMSMQPQENWVMGDSGSLIYGLLSFKSSLSISVTKITKRPRSVWNLQKVVVWQLIDYDCLMISSLAIWLLFSTICLASHSRDAAEICCFVVSPICCFYFYVLVMILNPWKWRNFAMCSNQEKCFIIIWKTGESSVTRALVKSK